MLHSEDGSDMLLQGDHLEELSPESHEQRAELSQVHVHQFCQLIRGLSFMLEVQKHFVIHQRAQVSLFLYNQHEVH